ncbi:hypothetical protein STRDD11_01412 [Streptococcus sp. DD11]|nr:hypothetical protein STRDD11_01412 [Streptococcus sp. DD11]
MVFDLLGSGLTRQLFFHLNGLLQVAVVGGHNLCLQSWVHLQQLNLSLVLADCCHDFFLEGYQLFDCFMAFEQGFQHHCFRQFLGAGLYHIDGILGPCYRQFQQGDSFLLLGRIDDKFSVHIAYLYPCDRAVKRNIRDRQGQRGAKHGRHLRRSIFIIGKHSIDDLHFIAEAFRKHRTDWAVNQTGGQGRIGRRTAFTLVEAAGILPSCIHFFFIVDLQGEEITRSHLLGHGRSR